MSREERALRTYAAWGIEKAENWLRCAPEATGAPYSASEVASGPECQRRDGKP